MAARWGCQMVRQGSYPVTLSLNPNPPKDTDGRREEFSGRGPWVRELQGKWPGVFGVEGGRRTVFRRRTGAPKALCGSCDARDGERIRSRELSRTGLARVCGDLRLGQWVGQPTVPSGREWNGLQAGQGATELFSPRPAIRGRCRVNRRCRAGDPSGQREEPAA